MRRSFPLLLAALWLGNVLPALDATLVGTALPTVIGSLDGLPLYAWVFAANLLALTITIPIAGKLADLFGRKPVYYVGMTLFTIGAILSAFVQNVEQLIICRVIIGIATGTVVPASQTIMGDAIPMERRAKLQWVFASAWLVASVLGPTLSSVIMSYLHWRLVFLVTVPLGLVAAFLLTTQYEEHVERKSHRIDYSGVALLGGGVLALLFAFSPTNRSGGINFASSGGLLALAAVLLAAFLWNERRAAEPVLPPKLFMAPVLGIAALGSLASGMVQSGASSFVTIFVQGGQGGTPAEVGWVLGCMTIGWPIGAGVGGRMLMRVGFRRSIIAGLSLVALAQIGFLMLNRDSSTFFAAACMTVLGLGFGFSSVGFMISVQNSVGWQDRGVATASLQFFRSIGGSVGVAIMGTIVGMRMQPVFERTTAGTGISTSALLDPVARNALDPGVLATLQRGMTEAVHDAFFVQAFAAVAGLIAVLWFPRVLMLNRGEAEEAIETSLETPAVPTPVTAER